MRYQSEIKQFDSRYNLIRTLHCFCNNKRELYRVSLRQDKYMRSIPSAFGINWYSSSIIIKDTYINKCLYKITSTRQFTSIIIKH